MTRPKSYNLKALTAMRAIVCVAASAMVLVLGAAPAVRTQTPVMDARPVLTQYCFTCHNDRLKTGGLSLEALDLAKIGDSPDVWAPGRCRPLRRAGPIRPRTTG